jgi:hypothetical protein
LASLRFLNRLDRWAARFNNWFGATALAVHTGAEGSDHHQADPTAVTGLIEETKRLSESRNADEGESRSS